MAARAAQPALSPHVRRYYETIDRLHAETARVEDLTRQLHGMAANLRQLTLAGTLHLDEPSAKALAELTGIYQAGLVLGRVARDLSDHLVAADVA